MNCPSGFPRRRSPESRRRMVGPERHASEPCACAAMRAGAIRGNLGRQSEDRTLEPQSELAIRSGGHLEVRPGDRVLLLAVDVDFDRLRRRIPAEGDMRGSVGAPTQG